MKKENPFINLLFNIVIPLIILTKFSKDEYLGPIWGLLIALLFPLIYGLGGLIILKQKSLISMIGFIGVLLTGIIGILKFPPHWIAVKEAAIPFIIGIVVLFSTKSPWQLISKIFYNTEIFDIDKIQERLELSGLKIELRKKLINANILLSFSFFISAALNFFLAKIVVHSMPGTIEFNEEIGRMTMLSFPIIVFPSVLIMIFIFWYIISSIKQLTELSTSEILSERFRTKKK